MAERKSLLFGKKKDDGKRWQCSTCTLENRALHLQCSACGQERSGDVKWLGDGSDDEDDDHKGNDDDDEKGDDEKVEVEQEEYVKTIGENIAPLCGDTKWSDVTFLVGPEDGEREKITAHRIILASRSPVFEAMFYSRFAEATDSSEIPVPDVDPDSFKLMLGAIYGDQAKISAKNVLGALNAGNKYQVKTLVAKCVDYMRKDLTTNNACALLQNAPEWMDEDKAILSYIDEHAADVFKSKSFSELSVNRLIYIIKSEKLELEEVEVWKGVLAWAEAECKRQNVDFKEKKAKVLEHVMPHIRFPCMTMEELAVHVAPSGLLPSTTLNQLFQFIVVANNLESQGMTVENRKALEEVEEEAKEKKAKEGKEDSTLKGLVAKLEQEEKDKKEKTDNGKSVNLPVQFSYCCRPRQSGSYRYTNVTLNQLGTVRMDRVNYGGTTQGCLTADPVTKKVYYLTDYNPGNTVEEWPNVQAFINRSASRRFNLGVNKTGTYHAALEGHLYYAGQSSNMIYKASCTDGKMVTSASFPNAQINGSGCWSWGGYCDICLYVGPQKTLFALYQSNRTSQMEIVRLDRKTLKVLQTWSVPYAKTSLGYGFLVGGTWYFGSNYAGTNMNMTYDMGTSQWSTSGSFNLQAASYVNQVIWDPRDNKLFVHDSMCVHIYHGVAKPK